MRSTNAYMHCKSMYDFVSAGTTIVGCIFAGDGSPGSTGGIALGADTRATEGPIVADKNCEKVRKQLLSLSSFTSSSIDADDTPLKPVRLSSPSHLPISLIIHIDSLHRRQHHVLWSRNSSRHGIHALNTGREPRVVTAMTMLKQKLFQ